MLMRTVVAAAAVLGMAGAGFAQEAGPGMIGYTQGQAAVSGRPLMPGAEGHVALKPGEMLSTGTGRAEVELTPGVVLRLEPASVVKMVVAEPARSEVMLENGKANVIVGNVPGPRDVQIDTANGVETVLLERGVYAFDAKAGELKVYDGKASVSQTDGSKWVNVKGGHELALNGSAAKAVSFDESRDRGSFDGRGYGSGGYDSGYGQYALADGGYEYGPGSGYYGYGEGFPGFYGDGFYAGGFYPGFYGFYPGFYYGGGFGYGYGFRGGFGGFRGGRR